MSKKLSYPFIAFLQATGLVVYIVLISLFFNFVAPSLNNKQVEPFYAPIVMLLLFIMSAVISALLVLGRAGILFWEKRYREAFVLVCWTLGWGFFYFALFILMLRR